MALEFDADIFYYTGISLAATLSGKVLKIPNYFSLLIWILETLEPASYLAVVSATVGCARWEKPSVRESELVGFPA